MRVASLGLLLALGATTGLRADDEAAPSPPTLGVMAGVFDFTDDDYRAGELGVQYRGPGRWWLLQPMLGGMVTSSGALHLYLGFSLELPLGEQGLLRGSFAPGYYHRGDGKDLGSGLQFRSGLEIGWRWRVGWRIGIELYHLSNAQLGEVNPGENSLVLTLTVPLGSRRPPSAARSLSQRSP